MFDVQKAEKVKRFIESLCHTKGKYAGQKFILASWQWEDIIKPLFGTVKENGTRQYRTAYIEVPKKNGKSELAAAIALYLLFADGEQGAEIYSVAADRDQASIVFNVASEMVRKHPVLLKHAKIIDSAKRIIYPKTASFYRAVSADVPTKHGVNPHGVIFDELHAQPNRELWDIFTTASGTRTQPLFFAITTAGYDTHSICYEVHNYAMKVLKGVIKDDSFFAYIRCADEKDDWTDKKIWYKANPALGDFRSLEEMEIAFKRAKEVPSFQNAFRRYYLNQWVKQKKRYIDLAKWTACDEKVEISELEGMKCWAGLDMSSSIDITAFVLVFPYGDSFVVLPFFWIPEENIWERVKRDKVPYDTWKAQGYIETTEGNVIDYRYIKQRIIQLAEKYNIQEIAFDRWGMAQMSQELTDEGFTLVPFGQGFGSMSAPTKELLNLILQRKIIHLQNPVLTWMIDNLVVKQDPAGNIKPDKEKSTEKIDGVVAMIMALDRAIRNKASSKSVYDESGIKTL